MEDQQKNIKYIKPLWNSCCGLECETTETEAVHFLTSFIGLTQGKCMSQREEARGCNIKKLL